MRGPGSDLASAPGVVMNGQEPRFNSILITGSAGFTGQHLLAFLADVAPQARLVGVDQRVPARAPVGYVHHTLDLLDAAGVRRLVAQVRPQVVFHLVGLNKSTDPMAFYRANVLTTLSLLEALRLEAPQARLLAIGSAAEYGPPSGPFALSEEAPLRPVTVYGASKAAQTILLASRRHSGPPAILLRPFNLLGPGLPATLVAGAFALQIAEREVGLGSGPLRVGNLSAQRDFLDVRDAVAAYWLVAERGQPGTAYNVCSGRPVAVQTLLDILLSLARCSIEVVVDPDLLQPNDVPVSFGDNSRLRALGWRPTITLEQSLRDLLEECRQRVAARQAAEQQTTGQTGPAGNG